MRRKSEQKVQTNKKPNTTNDVRHEVVVGFERGDFKGPGLRNSGGIKKKKKKENNSTAAKENFRRKNFNTSQKKYGNSSKSDASQPRSGLVDFRFDKEAKGQANNEVGTEWFKLVNKTFPTDLKEEPSRKEEEKSLQKIGEEGVDATPALLDSDKEVENYFHPQAEQSAQSQEVGESVVQKTKTASEYNLCQSPKKPVNSRIQSLNNILSSQAQNPSSEADKLKNSIGCLLSTRRLVEEKSQNLSFSNSPKTQTLPIKSVSVEAGTSSEKPAGGFKSFKKKGRSTSFSSERVVEVPEVTESFPRSNAPKPPTPSKSLPRVRNFGLRKTLSTCPQPTVKWNEGKELPRSGSLKPNEEKAAPDGNKFSAEENTSKEGHATEKREGDVLESPRCYRTKGNNKKVCIYNCAATKDFNQKFLRSIYIPTTAVSAGKNQKRMVRNTEGAVRGFKFDIRPFVLGKQNQPPTGRKVYNTFKAIPKPAAKSNASNSSRIQKKKTTARFTTGSRQAKNPAKEDKAGVWQYKEDKSSKSPVQVGRSLFPVPQAKSTTKEETPTSPLTSQVKNQKTKTKVMRELEVLEKLFSKLKNLQSSMERQSVLDEKKEILKSLEKSYSSVSKLNTPEKKPDAAPPDNDLVLRQRKSIRTAIIHHVRNWLKLEFAYH